MEYKTCQSDKAPIIDTDGRIYQSLIFVVHAITKPGRDDTEPDIVGYVASVLSPAGTYPAHLITPQMGPPAVDISNMEGFSNAIIHEAICEIKCEANIESQ